MSDQADRGREGSSSENDGSRGPFPGSVASNRMPLRRGLLISIGINVLPLVGALLLGWRVEEVLLTYWLETVVLFLLMPAWMYASVGAVGAALGSLWALAMMPLLAGHAFFLFGMLYGVDWANAKWEGLGWSMPAKGEPSDWFAQAWADLPIVAVIGVAVFQLSALRSAWPRLKRTRDRQSLTAFAKEGMDGMPNPDTRLIAMHIALIFCGGAILLTGGQIGLLLLLIVTKLAFDSYSNTGKSPPQPDAAPQLEEQGVS